LLQAFSYPVLSVLEYAVKLKGNLLTHAGTSQFSHTTTLSHPETNTCAHLQTNTMKLADGM